jgi:inward rectifier potassium channel
MMDGSKSTRRQDSHTTTAVGNVRIRKNGSRWSGFNDPYHWILGRSWPQFFSLVITYFVTVNLVFAGVFYLVDGSVANARPGSFADLFFFSVETLATVGYGEMAPNSFYGHVVAAIEILFGMMSLAIVTGLIFVRFSKPTSRMLFSDRVVIRDFDGSRMLMLRVANERHNRIVEANASLGMVRAETTSDGEALVRIHDLPLIRHHSPVFALTWTLMHRIDESSPLFGWSHERLQQQRARIIASITGHDETMAAPVHALHDYAADQIAFEHRFADIISTGEDGERVIDLTRFHDIQSI